MSKQTNKQTSKQKKKINKQDVLVYISSSYLKYFLKSDLYFIKIYILWFVGNLFKIWWMNDVSCIGFKVGHQIESLSLTHALECSIGIIS